MSREDGDPAVGAIVDAGDGSGGGIGGAGGGPAFPRPDRGDCVSIAPMMVSARADARLRPNRRVNSHCADVGCALWRTGLDDSSLQVAHAQADKAHATVHGNDRGQDAPVHAA